MEPAIPIAVRGKRVSNVNLENVFASSFNPLHPKISIHILHTVLYTFLKVLTRRICLPIKSFFRW